MRTLDVFRGKDGWMVRFLVNGKPDPEVQGLFNSCVLPTAFTLAASPEEVREYLVERNPGAEIVVEGLKP